MNRERPLPPEVRALLEHERAVPPLSATTRARAIARARAALVAGIDRPVAPVPVRRHRWVAAAAVICILGGAVGAAAYQFRALMTPAAAPEIHPLPAKKTVAVAPVAVPAPIVEEAPAPAVEPHARTEKPLSKADAARAELKLLRQARAAVAREDYASALPPIAEHTRRFKDGRLAEEREALRVKALAGLGRTDEARRAASAFRARFPRSVLLPAVSRMLPAEP
jgi:hypothetical protein